MAWCPKMAYNELALPKFDRRDLITIKLQMMIRFFLKLLLKKLKKERANLFFKCYNVEIFSRDEKREMYKDFVKPIEKKIAAVELLLNTEREEIR